MLYPLCLALSENCCRLIRNHGRVVRNIRLCKELPCHRELPALCPAVHQSTITPPCRSRASMTAADGTRSSRPGNRFGVLSLTSLLFRSICGFPGYAFARSKARTGSCESCEEGFRTETETVPAVALRPVFESTSKTYQIRPDTVRISETLVP